MDVVIQIVPGDVSPLGISVKVTFASLQNTTHRYSAELQNILRGPWEGAGRGAWLSL